MDPINETWKNGIPAFEAWFNGLEGFHLVSERFISEAKHMDVSDKNIQRLIQWLQAAFMNGRDSVKVLDI